MFRFVGRVLYVNKAIKVKQLDQTELESRIFKQVYLNQDHSSVMERPNSLTHRRAELSKHSTFQNDRGMIAHNSSNVMLRKCGGGINCL